MSSCLLVYIKELVVPVRLSHLIHPIQGVAGKKRLNYYDIPFGDTNQGKIIVLSM